VVASATVGPMRRQSGSDLLLEKERFAEVASEHMTDPHEKLRDDRTFESKACANVDDVLRGRCGAGNDGSGSPGVSRSIENTSTARSPGRDRREQAPGDVASINSSPVQKAIGDHSTVIPGKRESIFSSSRPGSPLSRGGLKPSFRGSGTQRRVLQHTHSQDSGSPLSRG